VGVYQVNVQVTPDVPAGRQILQLTQAGVPANPVAVQIGAP
jgi:hypothetical protein